MKILFLISMVGSFLFFGCEQKVENVPNLSLNFEKDDYKTYLNQIRESWKRNSINLKKTEWNLKDLASDDYSKLQNKFNTIGKSYAGIYKHKTIRDSLSGDIKRLAEKLIINNKPILILYGDYSDSLAIRKNRVENEMNLKFVGCFGQYKFTSAHLFNSDYPNMGRNLFLLGKYQKVDARHRRVDNIYTLIGFQKFNEKTIEILEEKYGIEKIDEILKRDLPFY